MKSMIVAGGLALAALSMAPVAASAASFGSQADVGASASTSVETVQYGYGRRRYYRPRGYGYRRYRGYRRYARPRFYGYGYRPRARYYRY